MNQRTAREISVKDELLLNKDINIKIGTVENRNCPETVYVYVSFWVDCVGENTKEKNKKLYIELVSFLNKIYDEKFIKNQLIDSSFFVSEKENIFICNVPENFNYNNKPSFVSIELYLHTSNIDTKIYPLNAKKDTELFNECLKVSNEIGTEIEKLDERYKILKLQKKTTK